MAHHRLGNADQARRYANYANLKQAKWFKQEFWSRRVYAQQLFKEMKAVLAAPPDAKPSEVNDPQSGTHPSDGAAKPAADRGESDAADGDQTNNTMDD